MLVLSPPEVRFGATRWKDVRSIAIERRAAEEAVEWSDAGPHAVFADVVRQRVVIRVVLESVGEFSDSPKPGDSAALSFDLAPGGVDARRRRVTALCVCLQATSAQQGAGSVRTIEFIAVSSDGATDPVAVSAVGGVP